MLIKASNGIVDSSLVEGSTMFGIFLGPEYYWAEAGYVSNVTLSNNKIVDVAIWPIA